MKPLAMSLRWSRVGLAEHGVGLAAEQALVHVHAAAVLAVERLGHEGGVHAVVRRDLLDDEADDHDAVGHEQRLVVVRVDLVLRRGDLVVAGLHVDAELVEGAHGLLAQVVAEVVGEHVEVAALVGELGVLGVLEVEVLELGADEELEAHVAGALELAAQHPARVALERLEVAVQDVAEHERRALVALRPRQHVEGVPVGHRHDVRLLDLGVAADGGAVEGGAALDHAVELAVGDLHHLQVAEDVREPQLDVLHVLVCDRLADRGLSISAHRHPLGSVVRCVRNGCGVERGALYGREPDGTRGSSARRGADGRRGGEPGRPPEAAASRGPHAQRRRAPRG